MLEFIDKLDIRQPCSLQWLQIRPFGMKTAREDDKIHQSFPNSFFGFEQQTDASHGSPCAQGSESCPFAAEVFMVVALVRCC